MIPQIPLALRFRNEHNFDDFFAAPQLVDALKTAGLGPTPSALYLTGPSASGKTHLLLAASAYYESHGRRTVYLPVAPLAGRLEAVLAGQDGIDVLCVDGLEAIAGAADEAALFHCHNRVSDYGGTIIYAASAAPADLDLTLPDLRSRLNQCTRLSLTTLDDAGRRDVLQNRAKKLGLELDEAVLDYIFRRVGRDLSSLTALVDRLDRESLAAQRRITLPFLRQVLQE